MMHAHCRVARTVAGAVPVGGALVLGALWMAAALAIAPSAGAQGTLAAQGFGYPPGQLSARAAALGGAAADFDPYSAVNVAALTVFIPAGIYFQYAPEFRRVEAGDRTGSSSIVRFPMVTGAAPVGAHGVIGLSASTFLDRTWGTQQSDSETVGDQVVSFVESLRSRGAITDLRLAFAWSFGANVSLGLGAHVFTGQNHLTAQRRFVTPGFSTFTADQRVDYSGSAVSGGALIRISRPLAVALTGRVGGSLHAFRNDTTVGRGDVPNSYGGSVEYLGWSGVTIAARANFTGWSSMQPLAHSNLRAFDAWDYGLGAEINGPRALGRAFPLRIGVRRRTLPFGVGRSSLSDPDGSVRVRETTVSGGTSLLLAGGRGTLDLSVARASRTADIDAREHAWILNIGLALRP